MLYSKIIKLIGAPLIRNGSNSFLKTCTYSTRISSSEMKSKDLAFTSPLPLSMYNIHGSSQLDRNVPIQLEYPKLQILDRPNDLLKSIIDVPKISTLISYEDIIPNKEITEPTPAQQEEKHAVRMIVIRKRKMKVHKRKKWRKKMKSTLLKIEIRRKIKKEKEFQAELLAKVKEGEKFDASLYVKSKLEMANKEILPHRWKGKRLPEFVIKHERAFAKKRYEKRMAAIERRKNMNTNAADY